jgi:hypothetical protein
MSDTGGRDEAVVGFRRPPWRRPAEPGEHAYRRGYAQGWQDALEALVALYAAGAGGGLPAGSRLQAVYQDLSRHHERLVSRTWVPSPEGPLGRWILPWADEAAGGAPPAPPPPLRREATLGLPPLPAAWPEEPARAPGDT